MSKLLAYNLTGAPLVLAAGNPSVPALPPSANPPEKGPGVNVTVELDGLSAGDYTALQAQVAAGDVLFIWDGEPDYATPGLNAQRALSTLSSRRLVWRPDATGADAPDGVYTGAWPEFHAALLAALPFGAVDAEIDARFSTYLDGYGNPSAPIPAGDWEMDGVWIVGGTPSGPNAGPFPFTSCRIDLLDGCHLDNLRGTRGGGPVLIVSDGPTGDTIRSSDFRMQTLTIITNTDVGAGPVFTTSQGSVSITSGIENYYGGIGVNFGFNFAANVAPLIDVTGGFVGLAMYAGEVSNSAVIGSSGVLNHRLGSYSNSFNTRFLAGFIENNFSGFTGLRNILNHVSRDRLSLGRDGGGIAVTNITPTDSPWDQVRNVSVLHVDTTGGIAATGDITAVAGSVLVDGDNFILDDGTNPAVTFEFDNNGSVVETNTLRAIVFTGTETADDVADLIDDAISNAPVLGISVTGVAGAVVSLINDVQGVAGNVAIVENVNDGGFLVTGMAGGLAGPQPVAITMPAVTYSGERFGVKDVGGAASAAVPITVTCRGTDTFEDGSTSDTVESPYGLKEYYSKGNGVWVRRKAAASAAYTPTNVTPDRDFDADTVAVAELADIVGTLITDLQARGLLG